MKKIFRFCLGALVLCGCKNLDEAPQADRTTFMHFYEGANSYVAAAALPDADGYIVAGTIQIPGDNPLSKIIVIKTDVQGKTLWQKVIDGGSASSLMVTGNGYIVVGDSIQYEPASERVSDLENDWSRIIRMDANGNISSDKSFTVEVNDPASATPFHTDFHADGITADDQDNYVVLGTYKFPGGNEFAYVAALNQTTLDTMWIKRYNYIERDYINSKSVYYKDGNVLWGSSVSATLGNFSRSYLTVPVVESSSVFINSDYFGQTTEQSLIIKDLQQSPLGYGVIGTYAQADGKKGNLFFVRTDTQGNFQNETARYFDGASPSVSVDPTVSTSEDTGEALAATRDGGFILAGSIETTPERGNGGKDIWLIKVDAYGNRVWDKIIGGPTNEIVASIRETADGGFIISGTIRDAAEETGGLSAMFLIRTDSNGELKN